MSMWYTCDPGREFGTFLDGKPHATYRRAKTRAQRRVEEEGVDEYIATEEMIKEELVRGGRLSERLPDRNPSAKTHDSFGRELEEGPNRRESHRRRIQAMREQEGPRLPKKRIREMEQERRSPRREEL